MTKEDKKLLLKDLCARLPYGVIGKCELDASYDTSFDTIFQTHKFDAVIYGLNEDLLLVTPLIENEDEQNFAEEEVADGVDILDFTPYLFPLSSMTEEQKKYITDRWGINEDFNFEIDPNWGEYIVELGDTINFINWLNENRFDINNLIPKGLAIDATGLNIYDKAKMNF